MVLVAPTLKEDYWETLDLNEQDIEFLYSYLLENETPHSPLDLVAVLIEDRLKREQEEAERQQVAGGQPYLPKDSYKVGDKVVFPHLGWQAGSVSNVRDARSYEPESFKVIEVEFDDSLKKEYAAELEDHKLNIPPDAVSDDPMLNSETILENYGDILSETLIEALKRNDDFVYIAGRWFPRALLVDVNIGNLNLAEAVLDMAEGGPLPTIDIFSQVGMPEGVNEKLAEFSLDLAMQDDARFDEVGSTGEVAWFLKRLEPQEVKEVPLFLRYSPVDFEEDVLDGQMLQLINDICDEKSSNLEADRSKDKVTLSLNFPHWRSGTLPLSKRVAHLFPSAYESPRVRFLLVDGQTGDKFPGWVVRLEKYVFGLRDWYLEKGIMPGSKVNLRRGKTSGEVIIDTEAHRSSKEWVRTALVGADGGVVFAMLKQPVTTTFDDWMMVYMPSDITALDQAWEDRKKKPSPFEQVVVDTFNELAKLNPQSHVHAAELYSAVNLIHRCPPEPILSLLMSRPWFNHVGDLYFRYTETHGET